MQVTPAIHALRHPFKVPVAPGIALDRFVYSYLIAGETITLVDTGVAGCETLSLLYSGKKEGKCFSDFQYLSK